MTDRQAYHKLRKFLFKLGIKSAELSLIEEAFDLINHSFGQPDKLYMDPKSFEQIQKIIKDKK